MYNDLLVIALGIILQDAEVFVDGISFLWIWIPGEFSWNWYSFKAQTTL